MTDNAANELLILTDSTADIPADLVQAENISVIPLNVYIDGQHYLDGIDLSADAFYSKIENTKSFPTTAPPTAEEFHELFLRNIGKRDILGIFISSKMSQTFNVANQTKMKFYNRYMRERAATPGISKKFQIELVDSRLVSMGAGLLVLEAAEKAKAGWSITQIKEHIERMKQQVGIYLMVDSLDHLARGGRIGRASALCGKLLDVKPLLGMENGIIVPRATKMGAKRAHKQLVEFMEAEVKNRETALRMAVCSAGSRSRADAVTAMLDAAFPNSEMLVGDFGPGVGAHTGPGAIGVAFYAA